MRHAAPPVDRLPRAAVVLGTLAAVFGAAFFVLLGLQLAKITPAPLDTATGIIAATLTITAVQIGKRDAPAREFAPASSVGVAPVPSLNEITVANVTRAQDRRFPEWDALPSGEARVYASDASRPADRPQCYPHLAAVGDATTTPRAQIFELQRRLEQRE